MKRLISCITCILVILCMVFSTFGCNNHEHTYESSYSYNQKQHWFASTCEHKNLKKDVESHEFREFFNEEYRVGIEDCVCGINLEKEIPYLVNEFTFKSEIAKNRNNYTYFDASTDFATPNDLYEFNIMVNEDIIYISEVGLDGIDKDEYYVKSSDGTYGYDYYYGFYNGRYEEDTNRNEFLSQYYESNLYNAFSNNFESFEYDVEENLYYSDGTMGDDGISYQQVKVKFENNKLISMEYNWISDVSKGKTSVIVEQTSLVAPWDANLDFYYVYANNGIAVTGLKQDKQSLVIPEAVELGGKSSKVTTVKQLYVYDEQIGSNNDCTSLSEIIISAGVTRIADEALANCPALTKITVPFVGVNDVNEESDGFYSLFGGNYNSVPASVEEVTVLGGEIKDRAFYNCSNIQKINVCDGVTYVDSAAFGGCSNLNYTENGNAKYLGNESNPEYALINVLDTDSAVEVSTNAKLIAAKAFYGYTSPLVIPENVIYICDGAFDDRLAVLTVPTYCDAIPSELIKLTINGGEIPDKAFENSYSLSEITLGEKVTVIGDEAFKNSGLTSVAINGDKIFGEEIFFDCENLAEVVLNGNITSIGNSMFSGCVALSSITLPNSITTIGESAFSGCSALTDIAIPDSVTTISYNAFGGAGLTKITIGDNVTMIDAHAFADCKNLSEVTIGKGVNKIGKMAFIGCDNLTKVIFKNTKGWGYNSWLDLENTKRVKVDVSDAAENAQNLKEWGEISDAVLERK